MVQPQGGGFALPRRRTQRTPESKCYPDNAVGWAIFGGRPTRGCE